MAYIAAVLEKEGFEVQVQDFLVSKYSKEKMEAKIADFAPEIIGITSVTMNYPVASQIIKDCKEIDQNIITIIGGPHVSFMAEEVLREAPWIDIIAIGESENTMLEIVSGRRLKDVDGIAFREGGNIVRTKPRAWIENLDELPLPARHLFPLSRYLAGFGEVGLITSRGCPFNCIFCLGHKMVGRKGRFRNPKLVVDEIEHLHSLGFKTINLVDDLFTQNHKHLYRFCDEILDRKLSVRWTAMCRVDTVNADVLGKMKEAGCFYICYGCESSNQNILDTARKKITPAKATEAVKVAKEIGINCLASFLIGLPGETKETLKETVEFARNLGTYYGFHILAPFPGTEVRERAEELGLRILTNDWMRYSANEAITETEGASVEDLNQVDREYYDMIDRFNKYLEKAGEEGKLDFIGWHELEREKGMRCGKIRALLLQEDIIENLGKMETKGEVIEELVASVAKQVNYPINYLREGINDMVSDGLLQYELHEGNVKWKWGGDGAGNSTS